MCVLVGIGQQSGLHLNEMSAQIPQQCAITSLAESLDSVYIHSVAVVEPFASHASHQSIHTGTHWRFISFFDVSLEFFCSCCFCFHFYTPSSHLEKYIFLSLFQISANAHDALCVCLSAFLFHLFSIVFCCYLSMKPWTAHRASSFVLSVVCFFFSLVS